MKYGILMMMPGICYHPARYAAILEQLSGFHEYGAIITTMAELRVLTSRGARGASCVCYSTACRWTSREIFLFA